MLATIVISLGLCAGMCAAEVPASGPERLVWAQDQVRGTASKFEFTQGYDFRKKPELLRPFMQSVKAHGFTTWDQMSIGGIWTDEDFASLEESIEVAEDVGLSVWATLHPPSGDPAISRMPLQQRKEFYLSTVERFARIAREHPNFVAFTCDDFDYNLGFFSPEMLSEMAKRSRAICPRLMFMPLLYYSSITPELFASRGAYIDGIVFHFRADSYPHAYIPQYDPKSFEMYGDVMRYELGRVRQIAGQHPVICGIYIWYYQQGWGVLTPDEQNPAVEHIVRDADQKITIAHELADGVRVYGLGIDHEAYAAMGKRLRQWEAEGAPWGASTVSPEEQVARWQVDPGDGPFVGTLLHGERGLGRALPRACRWPRLELVRRFEANTFSPERATTQTPMLVAARTLMRRQWPGLLGEYARLGGTLVLEFVPGWSLDAGETVQGEANTGENAPTTRELSELSGVRFHYEPRGFATRWRVTRDNPLTRGMGDVGVWHETGFKSGGNTYPYLVHPVEVAGAEVLIEVEHERCSYDGTSYVRKGEIAGVFPLLTVRDVGEGRVVRHYAHTSLEAVLGDAHDALIRNLLSVSGAGE